MKFASLNNMTETRFKPKTISEDWDIVLNDDVDFSKTKEYLDPLILVALNKFKSKLSKEKSETLHNQLLNDIPIAAKRFIANKDKENREFKFSTYFSWYIAQRINPEVVWYLKLWKKIKTIF